MAVEIAGPGFDIHLWAALEKTQVFPVKPIVSLSFVHATVAVFLFIAAVLVNLL